MQFRLFALLVGFTLVAVSPASAQLKDRVLIPAPIPDYGAVAVPGIVPVPEGFTYYLRADLGWGFVTSRNYTENGVVYGGPPLTFSPPFGFGGLSMGDASGDGVFLGTVGYGAYFTPRFRGDLTIDFRSSLDLSAEGTYGYTSTSGGGAFVSGSVTDKVKINNAVALANLYWDLLPRGFFTPYIGAGIGLAYYDATRTYLDYAVPTGGNGTLTAQTTTFSSKDTGVTLAGALMAGATFAIDQHWLIDVNYRALYLGEVEVVTNVNSPAFNSSRVTIGNTWEQQARIGLRYNIW